MNMTAAVEQPVGGLSGMYNEEQTSLSSRQQVNRDKTRYVFSLGDHIEVVDKPGFKSIGAHFGGLWVGASEIEGCPNLKRTNFMLYRGAITPVETTAIPRKADHREREKSNESMLEGVGVPPGVRGYTVYAGDGLNFLQSDKYRPQGVVELTYLQYKSWNESNARQLQVLLFPRWTQWLQGVRAPVLLQDWLAELNESFERHPELTVFREEMFEAGRLFRNFALGHIERNRQSIMSKRNVDSGGFFVGWNGRSRLYAQQLGIQLENEQEIRPEGGVQTAGDPALMRELREERKLRAQQMEQTNQLISLLVGIVKDKVGDGPVGEYVEQFQTDPRPDPDEMYASVEEEYDPAKFQEHVSFGNEMNDVAEVQLSTPVPQVKDQNNMTAERRELEERLEDPTFAAAVETDPGLRGAIKDNPDLVGAIEEEE